MKFGKTTAALAALAILGAPLFAPCSMPLRIAEAASVSRDVDQTPYNENVEVDPYGQAYPPASGYPAGTT